MKCFALGSRVRSTTGIVIIGQPLFGEKKNNSLVMPGELLSVFLLSLSSGHQELWLDCVPSLDCFWKTDFKHETNGKKRNNNNNTYACMYEDKIQG